jgi:hypothetical protein
MVIEDNTLRFDEVEIVDPEDTGRMDELGLSDTALDLQYNLTADHRQPLPPRRLCFAIAR